LFGESHPILFYGGEEVAGTRSVDDLVGAGFKVGRVCVARVGEIGVNADANRHARSEVVDVNIGDEQGGSAADQIMMAALVDKPEGNGSVPLSDFEGKGLALALGRAAASGAALLRPTRECPSPHDDAQDALDGRIEARLDYAGSPNVEEGVKRLDGAGL
jgi:hypothetical protein